METNQEMLTRMENEDFLIKLDCWVQDNGWNVFTELVKQLKEKYDPKLEKAKKEYRLCDCLLKVMEKTHLSHHERLALMMILLPMGKEQDLISIMMKQDNYKESVTMYQINNYKAKGEFKGISKVKLREWGICKC